MSSSQVRSNIVTPRCKAFVDESMRILRGARVVLEERKVGNSYVLLGNIIQGGVVVFFPPYSIWFSLYIVMAFADGSHVCKIFGRFEQVGLLYGKKFWFCEHYTLGNQHKGVDFGVSICYVQENKLLEMEIWVFM